MKINIQYVTFLLLLSSQHNQNINLTINENS